MKFRELYKFLQISLTVVSVNVVLLMIDVEFEMVLE